MQSRKEYIESVWTKIIGQEKFDEVKDKINSDGQLIFDGRFLEFLSEVSSAVGFSVCDEEFIVLTNKLVPNEIFNNLSNNGWLPISEDIDEIPTGEVWLTDGEGTWKGKLKRFKSIYGMYAGFETVKVETNATHWQPETIPNKLIFK